MLLNATGARLTTKVTQVRVVRMRERTMLSLDGEHQVYHVHREPNLDGADLYFGDYGTALQALMQHQKQQHKQLPASVESADELDMVEGFGTYLNPKLASSQSYNLATTTGYNPYAQLLVFGGLPASAQTFDLSLSTVLFERATRAS